MSTETKNVSTISNVLTIFRNLRKTSTCNGLETMQENANALQTIVMVINLQESEIHYLSSIQKNPRKYIFKKIQTFIGFALLKVCKNFFCTDTWILFPANENKILALIQVKFALIDCNRIFDYIMHQKLIPVLVKDKFGNVLPNCH